MIEINHARAWLDPNSGNLLHAFVINSQRSNYVLKKRSCRADRTCDSRTQPHQPQQPVAASPPEASLSSITSGMVPWNSNRSTGKFSLTTADLSRWKVRIQ